MVELPLVLIVSLALLAVASPGPATLAILGTSMAQGRGFGMALAAGVFTGSLFWSVSAAFGLGALMYTHVWLVEAMRYLGASYLFFLSYKSARAALRRDAQQAVVRTRPTYRATYVKGLLIHLTNPKAILFFGSLYALVVSPTATATDLVQVIVTVASVSFSVFFGYALLFSLAPVRRGYIKLRRVFEAALAFLFSLAAVKVLLSSRG
ncbi:LysE family translocator [Salinispirillum marinum]|uniref:LysE family translocator n=2 Tax=Saccharospirillaceae TaxID=255527 RepID=A0ABV8BEY1_9GAMM